MRLHYRNMTEKSRIFYRTYNLQNIVADHSLRIMTSVMVGSFFLFLLLFLEPQDVSEYAI